LKGVVWRGAACVILAGAVVGCASNKKTADAAAELPKTTGQLNAPLVLSGSPSRDTAAYKASEDSLGGVGWKNLEEHGPKPTKYGQIQNPDSERRDKEKDGELGVVSHRAAAAPATRPVFDESDLPIEQVDLPDGKVRIVWTLRNYGGNTVTSAFDGGTTRRKVTLAAPDLTPLVTAVSQQIPGGTVAPLPNANQLIITCDKAQRSAVLQLLADIDVPPRQVEITAKIFEVSHDFDFQQGARLLLKHISSDGAQTGASTFNAPFFQNATQGAGAGNGSVIDLMQTSQAAGLSLEASFQIMAQEGLIKVVSSPRMTVAVGATGTLLAGQEIPIQSAQIVNNALQATTTYKPVGVQLYITPQAVGRNRVKLHTISVVSSLSGFTQMPTIATDNAATSISNLLINPVIDTREAETAVTVEDGNTLVISGLRMVRQITRTDKVPGLGDIPVLGWLFKNQRTQQQQTDLYFFVTPTLL
jgi:type II secretory pathway component GspD/PulD (secretin)